VVSPFGGRRVPLRLPLHLLILATRRGRLEFRSLGGNPSAGSFLFFIPYFISCCIRDIPALPELRHCPKVQVRPEAILSLNCTGDRLPAQLSKSYFLVW
jgi:hypothetical protein